MNENMFCLQMPFYDDYSYFSHMHSITPRLSVKPFTVKTGKINDINVHVFLFIVYLV